MKILRRTNFGNPILRQAASRLSRQEVASDTVQQLIADMIYTIDNKKYGVGLAAPQVGHSVALSVVTIKPTPSRPNLTVQRMVVINPEIVQAYGRRQGMWEGCVSFGGGSDFPYAKALRYKRIRLKYWDETGKPHESDFEGMLAHVLQHETDHLNGILFVDRVRDPKTYMNVSEYKKRLIRPM